MISEMTGTPIQYLKNPRNEANENDLHVINDRFLGMGLEPITLKEGLMQEVTEIAQKLRRPLRPNENPLRLAVAVARTHLGPSNTHVGNSSNAQISVPGGGAAIEAQTPHPPGVKSRVMRNGFGERASL